jgi:hypothetical protein
MHHYSRPSLKIRLIFSIIYLLQEAQLGAWQEAQLLVPPTVPSLVLPLMNRGRSFFNWELPHFVHLSSFSLPRFTKRVNSSPQLLHLYRYRGILPRLLELSRYISSIWIVKFSIIWWSCQIDSFRKIAYYGLVSLLETKVFE